MLEYLTKDDLPESIKDLADIIGIDSLKKLVKFADGSSLYIPSESSITKPVRNIVDDKSCFLRRNQGWIKYIVAFQFF